jgi:hypothetical protein
MVRYIAKSDTWFDVGTECELLADYRPQATFGLFRGLRTTKLVERHEDEEICSFDEFEVVDGD